MWLKDINSQNALLCCPSEATLKPRLPVTGGSIRNIDTNNVSLALMHRVTINRELVDAFQSKWC